MSSAYQKALDAGYSASEIQDYFAQKDPQFQSKYEKALETGYEPSQIYDFLSQEPQPSSLKKEEGFSRNLNRQFLRGGLRATESVLGAPRALGELSEALIPEKLIKKGAEKVGIKEPIEKGLEFAKKHAPYKVFPKQEEVRKVSDILFPRISTPRNQWEEKADETISDFAALAVPLPGKELKLMRPALTALGANLASEAVGELGGTEKQQSYAKLGTFLIGSLIHPKSAINLEKDLYTKARQARPDDAIVPAEKLNKSVDAFEKQLLKGDPQTASKKKSFALIKEIKNKIKDKNIEVEDLEEFKRNINEARSGLYEEFKIDKVGRKSAKRNLDHISNFINKSLNEYGRENPEWEAFYRPANEVHGAISQSKRAREVILRNIHKYKFPSILGSVLLGHSYGAPAIGTLAGGVAAGGAALMGGELATKLAKSPTFRKHYTNLISAALKNDSAAIVKNLEKLQKEE